jgi:ABC-type oligopeptide transport system ATPase subunit
LGCIEAPAQMPILIHLANPLNKKAYPDDSRQLNHLNQALQLEGNNEEHYHKTPSLVEGKQMQDFSMSKTCKIMKGVSAFYSS